MAQFSQPPGAFLSRRSSAIVVRRSRAELEVQSIEDLTRLLDAVEEKPRELDDYRQRIVEVLTDKEDVWRRCAPRRRPYVPAKWEMPLMEC